MKLVLDCAPYQINLDFPPEIGFLISPFYFYENTNKLMDFIASGLRKDRVMVTNCDRINLEPNQLKILRPVEELLAEQLMLGSDYIVVQNLPIMTGDTNKTIIKKIKINRLLLQKTRLLIDEWELDVSLIAPIYSIGEKYYKKEAEFALNYVDRVGLPLGGLMRKRKYGKAREVFDAVSQATKDIMLMGVNSIPFLTSIDLNDGLWIEGSSIVRYSAYQRVLAISPEGKIQFVPKIDIRDKEVKRMDKNQILLYNSLSFLKILKKRG